MQIHDIVPRSVKRPELQPPLPPKKTRSWARFGMPKLRAPRIFAHMQKGHGRAFVNDVGLPAEQTDERAGRAPKARWFARNKKQNTAKKSLARRIAGSVAYVGVILILVFGLPRFLSWSLDTPYPMAAITSGSMWPALQEGDLVFIQGTEREDLSKGDIVVFRNPESGTFTIHRVVALGEKTFTTKGDANFENDAPVPYSALIGKSVELFDKPFHIPYLGSVTVFANNLK